ncbi:MAG: tetratricopeptide repeat protein [Chlamydiae bacterium]|nr:tetratricopeptide repeat protein [Chlamydiota bacterium]
MHIKTSLDQELFLRAVAERDKGNHYEALSLFHKVLESAPKRIDVHIQIGLLYLNTKDLKNAQVFFEKALTLHPDFFEPYFYLAFVHHQKREFDLAINWYSKALLYKEDQFEIHANLGGIYLEISQFERAILSYERALLIEPSSIYALNLLATSLININRLDEARTYLAKSLAREPLNPQSLYLLGIIHKRKDLIKEAIECFSLTLRTNQDHFEALFNRAECYSALHEYDLAIKDFERAAIEANNIKESTPRYMYLSEWNLAQIYLKLGDYLRGWRLYENRFHIKSLNNPRLFADKPLMTSLEVANKVVLVYAEQGYGDVIQFCRYLLLLKERCRKIVFLVPKSLVELMEMLSDDIIVIHGFPSFDDIDLQVPLLSLPMLFNTQVATIPKIESYLRPNDLYMKKWGQILGEKNKTRIGFICTSGKNTQSGTVRDVPVKIFSALFSFPFEFHLLQLEMDQQDKDHLSLYDNVICHVGNICDFSDTAAIISHMDLVISVDTGPAHLAAAIGKPVWIMLPIHADFRWMLNRRDSLWYKTVTLFRQQKANDWSEVISSVAKQLYEMLCKTARVPMDFRDSCLIE